MAEEKAKAGKPGAEQQSAEAEQREMTSEEVLALSRDSTHSTVAPAGDQNPGNEYPPPGPLVEETLNPPTPAGGSGDPQRRSES